MSTFHVTVIGHDQPIRVTLPDRIEFAEPVSDADARFALARVVAEAVLPVVHDVPAGKDLERDASGQVQRSLDRAAVSRNVVAAQVGWEVAGKHLEAAANE